MPVKFLPKTSSSGGMSSLGVVVSTIDTALGSIPGSLAVPGLFDSML